VRLLTRALAVVALALLAPATATAATTPITDGHLDWGLKASFRSYIGESGITLSQGATRNADGTFRFPVVSGSYDDATKTTDVTLKGQVRFYAHAGALDMTLTNPHVVISTDDSTLYGDMDGKDLQGTPYSYPGVPLGALGIAEREPDVTDTTTTWAGVPVTLTVEGTPAFAGFYVPGTVLDTATLAYTGPGGKPAAAAEEVWTAPATPGYAALQSTAIPAGVVNGGYDASRGWVWLADYDTHQALAYDATTLAPKATVDFGSDFNPRNVAVDPRDGTVYVVDTSVKVLKPSADGFAVTQSLAIPGAATNDVAVDPVTGDVWVSQTNEGGVLRIYKRSGDVYTPVTQAYDYAFQPGQALFTPSGRAFVLRGGFGSIGGISEVTLSGDTITTTPIPGTDGVTQAALAPDGTLTYGTTTATYPPLVIKTQLTQATPASGGWTTSVLRDYGDTTLQLSGSHTAGAVDGWPFFALADNTNTLAVVRDAAHTDAQKIALPGSGNAVIGLPTGEAVVAAGRSLQRIGLDASPSITAQPQDATVGLLTGVATGPATFTVAAAGISPTFQWQRKAIGSTTWRPISGATEATLTVAAGEIDNGTQYRAVVANGIGKLATSAARLTVQTQPAIAVQPVGATVDKWNKVDLIVGPLGNPAPTVRWQVASGGGWSDVPEGTGSTLHVDALCDGASYRAVLTNPVGSVVSSSALIKVNYALSCATTIAPVTATSAAPATTPALAPVAAAPVPSTGASQTTAAAKKSANAPKLRALSGTRKVDALGRVDVAALTCSVTRCRLAAPKRVALTIGTKRYRATVLAPSSLKRGQRGVVRLQVPAAARKRLARHPAKVAVKLTLGTGRTRHTATVRTMLGGR
jgi:hypothetical protein